jgi:hypothetical protein
MQWCKRFNLPESDPPDKSFRCSGTPTNLTSSNPNFTNYSLPLCLSSMSIVTFDVAGLFSLSLPFVLLSSFVSALFFMLVCLLFLSLFIHLFSGCVVVLVRTFLDLPVFLLLLSSSLLRNDLQLVVILFPLSSSLLIVRLINSIPAGSSYL